jgi:hypothetical protein
VLKSQTYSNLMMVKEENQVFFSQMLKFFMHHNIGVQSNFKIGSSPSDHISDLYP